jgi:hypothetical protein
MIVRAELVAWKTVSALTSALLHHHHGRSARRHSVSRVSASLSCVLAKNSNDTSSHERVSLGLSAAWRKQEEFTMVLIGTVLSDQVYVLWHSAILAVQTLL